MLFTFVVVVLLLMRPSGKFMQSRKVNRNSIAHYNGNAALVKWDPVEPGCTTVATVLSIFIGSHSAVQFTTTEGNSNVSLID